MCLQCVRVDIPIAQPTSGVSLYVGLTCLSTHPTCASVTRDTCPILVEVDAMSHVPQGLSITPPLLSALPFVPKIWSSMLPISASAFLAISSTPMESDVGLIVPLDISTTQLPWHVKKCHVLQATSSIQSARFARKQRSHARLALSTALSPKNVKAVQLVTPTTPPPMPARPAPPPSAPQDMSSTQSLSCASW